MEHRNELIRSYYLLGLNYKDIATVLALKHRVIISERQLKRILKDLGLSRRIFSDIGDVLLFVKREMETSGQLHGYRWMHAKCLTNGIQVRKEDIRLILSVLYPEACNARRARRLHRRLYYSKGPDFIWHLDGYDKLKPYGFCINGCIDGYSRKIIWLHVYNNNNNPRIIGSYYIKAVENLRGCPETVRGDFGTENCHVKEFQRFFRRNRGTGEIHQRSYLEGTSTHNQRIEHWWGHLRKQCTEFWMTLFEDLRNDGHFSGDYVDTNILQFCFMGMIQVGLINYYIVFISSKYRTLYIYIYIYIYIYAEAFFKFIC
jgi:hypothetical protein